MVGKLFAALSRWRLWLMVQLLGRKHMPFVWRRVLRSEQRRFDHLIRTQYKGRLWRVQTMRDAVVQPFLDLLNRPSGGQAYCGGVLFTDSTCEPTLRHFRGEEAIDSPLNTLAPSQPSLVYLPGRKFWCGPLAFHFGHQIADFGSRVLLSSIDPRGGELLWCPWRSGKVWEDLSSWQQFLLTYLNPGCKPHVICTFPVMVQELIVVPQQARMRAAPTAAHLDALSLCERSLQPRPNRVVYVSRSLFAPCISASSLLGGFAAEALFETFLLERGVVIIYPETLSLQKQLEIYRGAEVLIVAEGSAQHGLELLGFDSEKRVVVICRRPQTLGMDWPLRARFPRTEMIQAVTQQWMASGDVAWNGLAILDWSVIAKKISNLLSNPLTQSEVCALEKSSQEQLCKLAQQVQILSTL